MTCKELIEYLSGFSPDDVVCIIVADIEKRLRYKISNCIFIDETPALMLETS